MNDRLVSVIERGIDKWLQIEAAKALMQSNFTDSKSEGVNLIYRMLKKENE